MKAYLDIVRKVVEAPDDAWKPNRTGVMTKAISGAMFEHDLRDGFPLLTTKKVSLRLVAVELEFFIKGLRDKRWLQERNCHIWDEWCNPQIVPYGNDPETKARMAAEADLGRVYGVQWRDFNGTDQLANLVRKLKADPTDRRLICSAWNPSPGEMEQMALPPCHLLFQVIVTGRNLDTLNLNWYQRSVDTMLGLPFNIASYGLLLELLAREAGLQAGKLRGMLGDVHIYENHYETALHQLEREPLPLPRIEFPSFSSIFDWEYTQVSVQGYRHHGRLDFEIAV